MGRMVYPCGNGPLETLAPAQVRGPCRQAPRGGTALALLVVTAALVVLLAVVFHLGVAAAVVGIVGILATVPSAYLAWAALPAIKVPVRGRPAGLWDPLALGVHQVIGGGPMPPYVRRPHDELLRAVLDPAVPASRLVVVRGGSSTGKTRAAYEAVVARVAKWPLDYPQGEADLAALLEDGVPPGTVLWLGELRQYTRGPDGGAAVLGRLARLLEEVLPAEEAAAVRLAALVSDTAIDRMIADAQDAGVSLLDGPAG